MNNKKKWLMAIATGLFATTSIFAQTSLNPWGISLTGNYKEYAGEYGNGFIKFRNPNIQAGVGCWRYLNSYFDAGLDLNYGKFTHDPAPWIGLSSPLLEYKGLQSSLTARFKFNNGKMLKEDAFLAPYLTLGFGFYTGTKTLPTLVATSSKAKAFNLPMGFGVRANITPRVKFFMQTTYMPTFIDNFDDNVSGKRNDKLWEHKLGFTYCFGKGKEADSGSSDEKK